MTTLLRSVTLSNAAWREAARLRHPEVDVDHVLLALVAAGGPAAELLGRHGVSLTRARRAAAESRTAVFTELGLDPAPGPDPLPMSDLHVGAAGEIPMSDRATALLSGLPRTWSEIDLLVRALQGPASTNADVLRRCGVDPAVILAEASDAPRADAHDPRPCAPVREFAPPVRGTRVAARRMTHMISAPIETVHRAVTDATLVARWLGYEDESTTVDADTLRRVDRKGSRTLTTVWTRKIDEPWRDGLRVVWASRLLSDGRWADVPGEYADLHLRAVPGGTAVDHTFGNRTFGRFARPAMWLAALGTPIGMVHRMHNLAFVAADLQN